MRYHLASVRMVIIKTKIGEDVKKRELLCTVGGNENWCRYCGKQYGDSSKKIEIEPPYDLGIYPKEMKSESRDFCTPMPTFLNDVAVRANPYYMTDSVPGTVLRHLK